MSTAPNEQNGTNERPDLAAWDAEFFAPVVAPAVKPIELDPEAEIFYQRDKLSEALRGLNRQVCVVLALRAARRVRVLRDLSDVRTEATAAGFDWSGVRWYGRAHADDAADAAAAAAYAAAYAYAYAAADDDDAARAWKAISIDFWRLKKLAETSTTAPLTGWDDPRLGPLWPDGEPEWHRRAERELRELKAQLANRPDPLAPPISDETRARLDDHRELNRLCESGELAAFAGQYVIVYRGKVVGQGKNLREARKQVAARHGVSEGELAYRYVY